MSIEPVVSYLHPEVNENEAKSLWIFAYGSLCWKPGFQYRKSVTGYVNGYTRKFWQGNNSHRGTSHNPGRVATLVEDKQGVVHGIAFAISEETAIPYLNNRECEKGGYLTHFAKFQPSNGVPFQVLIYVATPVNSQWLGDAETSEIAEQIVNCKGESGHNVEYLIRLANFTREHFPFYDDTHLFGLEREVLEKLKLRNICHATLMGNGEGCVRFVKRDSASSSPSRDESRRRPDSFQFTTKLPEKTLRCLNI